MRTLVLNRAVITELKKLPPEQYRQVVSAILDLLAEPSPFNSAAVEETHYRRLMIGKSRVVYAADEECVHVVAAGSRKDGWG
jgi:mRNA interferase RelE/StbE